jgi:NAD(P)-dependent dehydrogenase (short-subunit alcohol dehydrogenase family)
MNPTYDFTGQVALVTGAAGGMGLDTARAFATAGAAVVLADIDGDAARSAAAELTEAGYDALGLTCDVADEDQVAALVDRTVETNGRLDMAFNNAGIMLPLTDAADEPAEAFDRVNGINLRGVWACMKHELRVMREQGSGAIINVSSTAGFVTMGHYSAIKAYVTTFTEALNNELAGSGVTATALCPGWVRTEFHERASIRTGAIPGLLWLDADELVEECLQDVAAGKAVSIPSLRYKVLMFGARHTPRAAIRAVSRRLASGRH